MKKWIIGIVTVAICSLAAVYIFIPGRLEVSVLGMMKCNAQAVFRQVGQSERWEKWWPGGLSEVNGQKAFRYGSAIYNPDASHYPLAEISILHEGKEIKTKMSVVSVATQDSSAIYWQCYLDAGSSPFSRLRQYFYGRALKHDMNTIFSKLRPFVQNEKNIYGMTVGWGGTPDTFLVATKSFYRDYPTTQDIYRQLDKLKKYIARKGTSISGYPMDNITPVTDSGYQLMTAIPTKRPLEGEGDIYFRRLVPAKFLIAEVKGGDHSVREGWVHFREYVADHERTVMAIPWEYLVTDRLQQPDTAKWSTWLYYPVF
ncbi:MAG: hypothetical protein J0H07_06150 [Sphingobacteriales bacterium]|nr:hypothetical protein [Sphingobacteriales bacterium]